jgi:cyclomaltodextrinase / maltogenic alpha-amylase / neopullulanase
MSLEPDIPAWVKDAVFYQIFPDRFARSGAYP